MFSEKEPKLTSETAEGAEMREEASLSERRIEDRHGYLIPESAISKIMSSSIRRFFPYIDLIKERKLDDDFYQALARLTVEINEEFNCVYGIDIIKNERIEFTPEQFDFIYKKLHRSLMLFLRENGLGSSDLERMESIEGLVAESGYDDSDGSNADKLKVLADNRGIDQPDDMIKAYIEKGHAAIMESKLDEDKKAHFMELFDSLIKHGSAYFDVIQKQKKNVVKDIASELGSDSNQTAEDLRDLVSIIRDRWNVKSETDLVFTGSSMYGVKESQKPVWFDVPLDKPTSEQIEIIKKTIGFTEDDMKTRRTVPYTLLKRAKENGGKCYFFPGYHKK
jgi:hypothetical protein